MLSIMPRFLEISVEIEMERLGPWANFLEKVILLLRYSSLTVPCVRPKLAVSSPNSFKSSQNLVES